MTIDDNGAGFIPLANSTSKGDIGLANKDYADLYEVFHTLGTNLYLFF